MPVVAGRRRGHDERRRASNGSAIAPDQLARLAARRDVSDLRRRARAGWPAASRWRVLACGVRCARAGSIWYPINLLAAAVYAQSLQARIQRSCMRFTLEQLSSIAVLIHAWCRRSSGCSTARCCRCSRAGRSSSGGLIAPLLWSGLALSDARTDESAAGQPHRLVLVHRVADRLRHRRRARRAFAHTPMPTRENCPFAVRAGVEAAGDDSSAKRGDVAVSAVRTLSARRDLVPRGAPVLRLRRSARPASRRLGVLPPPTTSSNSARCTGELRRVPRRRRSGRRGDRARQSRVSRDRRRRDRSARSLPMAYTAPSMPAFAQSAGGHADRRSRSTRSSAASERAGAGRARSVARSRLPMRRRPRATCTAEKRLPDVLPIVPRRGRARRTEGQRDHERFVSRAGERSVTANDRDRGPPRTGRSGLARTTLPEHSADVRSGSHRRRELARRRTGASVQASPSGLG